MSTPLGRDAWERAYHGIPIVRSPDREGQLRAIAAARHLSTAERRWLILPPGFEIELLPETLWSDWEWIE